MLMTLLLDWQQLLRAWSVDGSLARAARHALELEGEQPVLDDLVAQWSAGDFSALPPITLLPARSMPGAVGAYAISTGTIYLNQDWLETATDERVIAVLTEEMGHHLDAVLNPGDTPGDEGELIARLLLGSDQVQAAGHGHDHDRIQILVDGEWIAAEASSLSADWQQVGADDHTAPAAPSTPDLTPASDSGSSDADNLTADTTPTFTGTAETDTNVELFAGTTSLGSTTADGSGNWSFTVPASAALNDGIYVITATATDPADPAVLLTTPIPPSYPGRTTQEVRNYYAFAALKDDGSVVTWGRSNYGGDSSSVSNDLQSGVTQIFSTFGAFAALKTEGSVVTWGDSSLGGQNSSVRNDLKSGVNQIFSNGWSFAALKDDGSVITWGNDANGGNSSVVSSQLSSGVTQIFSAGQAFAALKFDGSVLTWGNDYNGGNSSVVSSQLSSGVTQIFSTGYAFAALKGDGSVVTWGDPYYGGESSFVSSQIDFGVIQIFSTDRAFAALKDDGSVVTWGFSWWGGDSGYAGSQLRSGVTQIFSTNRAFAALKDDGSVVTWGGSGGDSGYVSSQLRSGVTQIFSTFSAFAALKDDGSVVTWGSSSSGGDSSSVSSQLRSGVTKIFSTRYAFAALKDDGSVVTWGKVDYGGDSSSIGNQLSSDVTQIFSAGQAFAALKSNGSVITWGNTFDGGDSSSVSSDLQSGVVTFADPFQDDRLVIESSDPSSPSSALTITVDTTEPAFTSGDTAAAIDENSGTNQLIYSASTSDSSPVTYSLKPGNDDDAASFSIDSTSGEVTLVVDPDYESQSSYTFTVVATDAAGNTTEQAVTLPINDLDDTPPAAPSTPDLTPASDTGSSDNDNITSDATPTFTGTAEPGSTINLLMDGVLYPANTAVTTADPITGEWSYTIPTEHAATEDITSSLTVTATDGVGNTSEPSDPLVIAIDLTPPVFVSGPTADSINENSGSGQVVYVAKGSDTHAVQYGLKPGDGDHSALLGINPTTGDVTLKTNPDYEKQQSYSFTVVATDVAGNSTEQSVSLAINDQPETGPSIDAIAEYGQVSVNHGWSRITLSNSYTNPVVITSDPTLRGGDPVAVRIRNIGGNAFDLRLQEPNYKDGAHTNETISYMVVEAGDWQLADGTRLSAGIHSTSKLSTQGFDTVSIGSGFEAAPAVLTQTQSFKGRDWVTTRTKAIGTGSFELTMQEEEKNNRSGHAKEDIGWVAIERGSSAALEADLTGDTFTHQLSSHTFATAFEGTPTLLSKLASYDGGDPANTRIGSISATGFSALVQEEQSQDKETAHTSESLAFLALAGSSRVLSGTAYQPSTLEIAEYGQISVDHNWATVQLQNTYTAPVVITSDPTLRGGDPAAVRLNNIDADSFDLRIQEPNYKDVAHTKETISYMVIEAGTWTLPDGTTIAAGTKDTNKLSTQGQEVIALPGAFDPAQAPAVLTQTQTVNGSDWVTTRTDTITGQSFQVMMQEEEKLNRGGHATETIGWLAVESGSADDGDTLIEGGTTPRAFDHKGGSDNFQQSFSEAPTLLTKLSSFHGADVANSRISAVSSTGFAAVIQEEQSLDPEIAHTRESLSFLALEGSSGILQAIAPPVL